MAERLDAGKVQLVDVRERHEVAAGTFAGATHFALSDMTSDSCSPPPQLDRSRTTYLFCARGIRVHPAASVLSEMGFGRHLLVPLSEGYEALASFGRRAGCTSLQVITPASASSSLTTDSRHDSGSTPASASSSLTTDSRHDGGSSVDSDRFTGTDTSRGAPTEEYGEATPSRVRRSDKEAVWLSAKLNSVCGHERLRDAAAYEEIDVLGTGAFGLVLLMRHKPTGDLAVCKSLRVRGLQHKEARQLATEVAVQSRLRHKFVVPLLGYYEEGDNLCLLLSYYAGGSLHRHLNRLRERQRSMDIENVTTWMSQIAMGLEYVHAQRVLHRDLSSGNVFLSFEGDALIGDFGLSYKLDREECSRAQGFGQVSMAHAGSIPQQTSRSAVQDWCPQPKTQCGTPNYMSPELVHGERYGVANDVWALGVIVFEMLTLSHPFHAPSLGGIIYAISNSVFDPEAMRVLEASDASPALRKLVSREGLLHPDPRERMTLQQLLREFPLLQDA